MLENTRAKLFGFVLIAFLGVLILPGLLSPGCGSPYHPLCDDWTLWIRDYQSLIGGLLAGGGALWTLKGMRQLDAEARQRHQLTEDRVAEHQRQNIILAIWPTAQRVQRAVLPNISRLSNALERLEWARDTRGMLMGEPGRKITFSTLYLCVPALEDVIAVIRSKEYAEIEYLYDTHTMYFTEQLRRCCNDAHAKIVEIESGVIQVLMQDQVEDAFNELSTEMKMHMGQIDMVTVNLASTLRVVVKGLEKLSTAYRPYCGLPVAE